MRSLQGRSRAGIMKFAVVASVGVCVGLVVGFGFMSIVDTVLSAKTEFSTQEKVLPGTELQTAGYAQQAKASSQSSSKNRSPPGSEAKTVVESTNQQGIHALCTSNGSPYLNYQTRIMYGSYQLMKKMDGGANHVAFTRILHRTKDDALMAEVPTFRASPLTPACDDWCEFPVSDRPNAVRQFFDAVQKEPSMLQAPWLLMIETDYVWMKPLQAPKASEPKALSLAFPFSYINPQYPTIEGVIRKMYPPSKGPISNIPGTGPAPVMMQLAEWIKVLPDWERLTAHIEADPESKEQLGWVREMYAFSVALALQGIKVDLALPPSSLLISQPPADPSLGRAAMFHYTWGTIFNNATGGKIWEFDKRVFTDASIVSKPPSPTMPPPFDPALKLQDGKPVTKELHSTLTSMLTQINTAIKSLPALVASAS